VLIIRLLLNSDDGVISSSEVSFRPKLKSPVGNFQSYGFLLFVGPLNHLTCQISSQTLKRFLFFQLIFD